MNEQIIVKFEGFGKIPRLSRGIIITEKLDGTNAQVHVLECGRVLAGSRNRYITPEDDNYGFAKWVKENEDALRTLGPGRHFGEWWGHGIQRGYGLTTRRFSLFNVSRWWDSHNSTYGVVGENIPPECCHVVPVLYNGPFSTRMVEQALDDLGYYGSWAAMGFKEPEGVMVYHTAANVVFKKTIMNDVTFKGNVGE